MKIMIKFKFLVAALFLMLSTELLSQQDPQFTQYMDNTLFVNPAYAGSRGLMNMTAIHREQWVGMAGRPRSTTFGIHSPLPYESVGVGLTAVNDVIGPVNSTLFYADLSYTLRFKNTKGKLAFGLKGGVNLFSSRTDQLATTDDQDPNLITNIQSRVNPNFGAGIYYHTPQFFVGISTPKIIEQSYDGSTTNLERRHYFLNTGGVFNLSNTWKLRPTVQFKFTNGSPLSIDMSLAAIYSETLWLGLMHRWEDSFGAFVQYQIAPQFKAGIAYDQTVTEIARFNKGTYEILLSYDFVFKKSGLISPRYF